MNLLPSIIRKELLIRVPQSIVNEITCFVFYDNHPRDTKSIDVIVCTQRGEVREFFKRDVGATYLLQNIINIREIKLLRNSRCDLFYMIVAEDKIIILSRNEHDMALVHEINNVANYTIEDSECKGQAGLKIFKKDDAVPLILDENFETLQEKAFVSNVMNRSCDILPLVVQLKRKLSEAQYCVKFNESKYKELHDLRQQAIFHMYQKTMPDDSVAEVDVKEVKKLAQIEIMSPEVKLCNKKILIILNVVNKNHVPLEDVAVLLHTSKQSITYGTKLYTEIVESPYWQEKDSRNIEPHSAASVVAVVDLKELQYFVNSRIQVEVVLSYSKEGQSLLLPFKTVLISANDIMGESFDVLSSNLDDKKKVILCVLSSGENKTLNLKHITDKPSEVITPYEIFCTHLKMELLSCTDNVAIHNLSPYHILHGVIVVFTNVQNHDIHIEVYTRSPSQVLALIHYIYDAVPYRIIVLTTEMKMSSLQYTSEDNEEVEMQDILRTINIELLGESLMNQTLMLKEYLDECLIKMNETKDPMVHSKIGIEIDITAQGVRKFLEFRQKILDSTEQGISGLQKNASVNKSIDSMVIDE